MHIYDLELIRTCRFQPYRKGIGPTFTLTICDCHRTDSLGKSVLAYRLKQRENGQTIVIFDGEDFACSPLHGLDSDATVKAIMKFLTLRPGDTDAEYFAEYTPAQVAFADAHAEVLSAEVDRRFNDEV